MSDPIDKLTSLGDALEGAPMPLPASAIRARGDRIRRRKHALVAGASAAAVAAVAVPVVALTVGNGSGDPDRLAPQPSASDPVAAAPLSAENLITADDAAWNEVGTEFEENFTYEGDGQSTPNPCFENSFASLGAEDVWQRDFQWKAREIGGPDPGPYLNEIIGEFGSPADARAAFEEIQGWYDDCLPPDAESFDAGEFAPVAIPVEGDGVQMLATYGPVAEELDPFGYDAWFLDTGLVVSGDRVALITALSHGQDYNLTPTPAARMVPSAAERLVLGNGVEQQPTEGEGDWPTAIREDFPLASGWPEDDGSSEFRYDAPSEDHQAMLPAGDLDACDQPVDGGDPTARLTTRIEWGSAYYARELQLFADADEAAAYLDSIQDAFAACEAAGPTAEVPSFTTEVNQGSIGEESWVVTRASDGIGRVVINVVRVGNAVAVDLLSDEGTGDTVMDLATETRENLADVIAAMNDLQGGGSAPAESSAPSAPAGTTEIPAEFPLASYPSEPPTADAETTIDGPRAGLRAVGDLPVCGVAALPGEPRDRLGYSVAGIEYGDLRELRTYGTADEAVAELQSLRALLATCDREPTEQDGWSNVWQVFENADPGYDSVTWGYTSEMDDSDSFAGSGQLMTAVRVGNSILVMAWYAEYNRGSMERNVPNLLDTVALITPAMCVFTADGC